MRSRDAQLLANAIELVAWRAKCVISWLDTESCVTRRVRVDRAAPYDACHRADRRMCYRRWDRRERQSEARQLHFAYQLVWPGVSLGTRAARAVARVVRMCASHAVVGAARVRRRRHELSAAAAAIRVALALREAHQIAARRPPLAAAPAARTQQVNGGPAAVAVALRSLQWPHLLLLLARERRREGRRDAFASDRRPGRVPRQTGRQKRQVVRACRAGPEVRVHLLVVRTARAVVIARVALCADAAGAETCEAICAARRALGE